MGFIEIFRLQLSDFHGALSLICTRDFKGNYFLESETFRVQLNYPDRLAGAGRRLKERAEIAVARDEDMKEGLVWQRDDMIEIGVGAGDTVYVQCGDLRIEPGEDQLKALKFALGRLREDYADIMRATWGGSLQMNIVQGLRGFLWPWEVDSQW